MPDQPHHHARHVHNHVLDSSPATSATPSTHWTPYTFHSEPTPLLPSMHTPNTANVATTRADGNHDARTHRTSASLDSHSPIEPMPLDHSHSSPRSDAHAHSHLDQPGPSRPRSSSAAAPSLLPRSARNDKRSSAACIPCRKRKRRCDGVKPICSTCQRSSSRQCAWDANGDRRKPVNKSMQYAFHARIQALEAKLDEYAQPSEPTVSSPSSAKGKAKSAQSLHDDGVVPLSGPRFCINPLQNACNLAAQAGAQQQRHQLASEASVGQDRGKGRLLSSDQVFADAYEVLFVDTPRPLLEHCLYTTFDHGIAPGRLIPRPTFFKAFVRHPASRSHAYSTFLLGSLLCLGAAYQTRPYLDSLFGPSPSSSCTHSVSEGTESGSDADGDEVRRRSRLRHASRDPAVVFDRFWQVTNSLISAELADPRLSTVCGLVGLVKTCFAQAKEALADTYLVMALRLCLRLDLHRDHSHLSPEDDRLHTLTFWACFWVETMLALRQGRPSRFRSSDILCGLPPIQPELDATFPIFISEGYRYQIQLFLVASDILEFLQDATGARDGEGIGEGEFEQVTALDLRLEAWYNQLPSGLRPLLSSSSSSSTTVASSGTAGIAADSSVVAASTKAKTADAHIICISLFFHLISLTLHRNYIHLTPSSSSSSPPTSTSSSSSSDALCRFSRTKTIRSIKEIVRLVKALRSTSCPNEAVEWDEDGAGGWLERKNPFLFLPITKAVEALLSLSSSPPSSSAVAVLEEDGAGGRSVLNAEREGQRRKDLDLLLDSLGSIGRVWTAAKRDKEVLDVVRSLVC
ncbi:uncharacterized protein PFL1_02675 [Pseudozyma flocculosa PF-1]|uniref:Zn(2)-C6 fungal-type domain-containing protein n=2 Tax=Pseudozyma flocculosa TaxID=84751 RepID=A0A5C3EYI0_9BASI|nr:uncharacterized protein PFL1_02675 [Pseudozyma flocculosa PF-1]EPQ30002.1 hypothetical protein PFL1_02675 [Pseudozyma flocculosa PF-1]SPO37323.1 uncharacterized protein PSFLO_02796 [Pseudozyma flocculosa]